MLHTSATMRVPLLAYLAALPLALAVRRALVVIDLQNDFVTGSLAVRGADTAVAITNVVRASMNFDLVALSQDWHPRNHCMCYMRLVGLLSSLELLLWNLVCGRLALSHGHFTQFAKKFRIG